MTHPKRFCLTMMAALALSSSTFAQFPFEPTFTRQDTLRGSITPERAWWDLTYYHLQVRVNPAQKTLTGENLIQYKVLTPHQRMQVDLQPPMNLVKATQNGRELSFIRDGNVYFITLAEAQKPGTLQSVIVTYEGKPKESRRPPWEGGVVWQKDAHGVDFIATCCQGDGASLWWPCKDHPYDEPDSMRISVTVPEHLTDVSNGRLVGVDNNPDNTRTFHWSVVNPINNYGVNLNIGDYAHFSEVYDGEKGPLDCNYYVLRDNLEKAKAHFKEVPRMLKAFEYWFGPYPFYEDGYKLVETPYTGMEHQSSVTYGNGYKNGYGGRDVSHTGWGMKFDFIIVHESGHEWFANSITDWDVADMWIHESFIAYSENLFVEQYYGKAAGGEYVIGTRQNIRNDRPIVGLYDVNYSGSGDMYYKGANMLHTLRQMVDDDVRWRALLRGLNETFYHQTVKGEQIEAYMSQQLGMDLASFFDQYLRDVRIPILEYVVTDKTLQYRWVNCVRRFNMPVRVLINGVVQKLTPGGRWSTFESEAPIQTVKLDPGFYAATFDLTGAAN